MTAPAIRRVTLRQACADFSVSYTSIYEAIKGGELPAIKPLSSWLVRPEDVEAWLVELDAKKAAS